jgi:putative methionine-R-sulfoxide reductase with GAF domain
MRLPVPSNLQTLARVATIAGHDIACQPLRRSECHPFVVPLTANGNLVGAEIYQL